LAKLLGNRWGARCEGKKGQVVRGLAKDDEARKLCPKVIGCEVPLHGRR
jgi:hypothetical protein